MYLDYLKIKIGKYNGLFLSIVIIIGIILFNTLLAPIYRESGISGRLFIAGAICLGFFVLLLCIINKCMQREYDYARKLTQRIFREFKEPFQRKWCRETIAIDLAAHMRTPLLFSSSRRRSEKILYHFLPYIFTGDNQIEKAENAFLNLLTLLEVRKAFMIEMDMNHLKKFHFNYWKEMRKVFKIESSNSLQLATAFIEQIGLHGKILELSTLSNILVFMQAIAYLSKGNYENFDEDQLEEFFDNWISFTEREAPFIGRHYRPPKSLNDREFSMENYLNEDLGELFFAFGEYCESLSPKKRIISIIGRKLIKKHGNIIPPENNETEEDE